MPIQVPCQKCNKKYAIKDQFAGKKVKCPGCGQVLTVPMPPSAKPKAGVRKKDDKRAVFEFLDEDTSRELTCSECGALLPPASAVCIKCGYHLKSGAKLETLDVDKFLGKIGARKKPPIPRPKILYVHAAIMGALGLSILGYGVYQNYFVSSSGFLPLILMGAGALVSLMDFLYYMGKKAGLGVIRVIYVLATFVSFALVISSAIGGREQLWRLMVYVPALLGCGFLALKSFDAINDEYCCL
jgi:ribosomal protein L40E/ribosomal protein S27E